MSATIRYAELASTNDEAMRLAIAGEAHNTWIVADKQTAGRGRRGRTWVSDTVGNLYCSAIMRLQAGDPPAQQLSFVAALAVVDVLAPLIFNVIPAKAGIHSECGSVLTADGAHLRSSVLMDPGLRRDDGEGGTAATTLKLKWPNDVLANGQKLAGLLLEAGPEFIIIGIGINLVAHPVDVERPATSMNALTGASPDPKDILYSLIDHFSKRFRYWQHHGFAQTRTDWLKHATGLGERIEVRLGNETLNGTFTDLATDGALLLKLDSGVVRPIHAGEVFGI